MTTIYSASDKHPHHKKPAPKMPPSEQTLEDIKTDIKHKAGTFGAFAGFPRRVTFETQEVKEEIILLLRKHIITNIPWLLIALVMILAPLILQIVPLVDFLPGRFQVVTIVIWYLIVTAYILENFLSWYFNVYIVTDERIVDVDFFSLIYKRISETKVDRIQDVTYSQGGFFQSIFNYGHVSIQTAGEAPVFDFEAVPQPARVAKILNQLVVQEEQEKIEGRTR